LLSIEALPLAMTIREDRTMTNVQPWSLLWQKQIIDSISGQVRRRSSVGR
jgi:hypothetical protein